MKKVSLLLLFFLFYLCQLKAQNNPANVSGCTIWKNQKTNQISTNKKEIISSESLNFNNEIFISDEEQLIISKTKLKSNFTFFVVFKSNEEQEKDILKYRVGKEQVKITNKQALNSNGLEYSKFDAKNGVILEYSSNLNDKKNSNQCSLFFGDSFKKNKSETQNQDQKTALLEFIYYPRVLTETEKLKVESYLSIKYGVSLIGDKNYLDSKGEKIWNFKDNKAFNHHVTGIGGDEGCELFQKQSINSSQNNLHIGFGKFDSISKFSKNKISNQTFLVWGNNNCSTFFKKDDNNHLNTVNKINRVWKIQITQPNNKNELSSFLEVDEKVFYANNQKDNSQEKNNTIWLAVSSNSSDFFDYENATYYQAEIGKNGNVIFNNIFWDKDKNGTDTFTFVEAPKLFLTYELIEKNCELNQNAKLLVKIQGGVSPFAVNIQHHGIAKSLNENSREFELELEESGKYELNIIDDKKQSVTQTIQTNSFDSFEGLLASEWLLNDDSEVEIVPNISSKNSKATYIYQWEINGEIISKEKTLKVNQQGNYSLKIKNDKGCEKTFPFTVSKKISKSNNITVYPNPVQSNEDFKIKFDLEKTSNVEVKIYTLTGVLLKHDKIENVSSTELSYKLQTSGSYLIIATSNNQSITSKLIVK